MPMVKVNNVGLFYQIQGNAQGETVVFVNGLLTDAASWAQHVPAFSKGYRVVTYDCRGQGQSDKPDQTYYTSLHAQDLLGLMDALEIDRAHLVGLSNGGAAVLQFAVDNPERANSLVLVDAYARVDAILKAKLQSWVAAMEAGGSPLRFDVATPYVWGGSFLERNLETLSTFREKGRNLPITPAKNLIQGAMVHDCLDRLGEIKAPVLLVVGEEDILTPVKYSRAIQDRVAGAELAIIKDAGHASCLEKAAEFNQIVLDFLARRGAAATKNQAFGNRSAT